MANDDRLANRIRAALANVPDVKEKEMFGSLAFMVSGKICISARADRIMCRIDPELHEAALKRSGCRTVVMKGREYRGYVYVDSESVKSKKALNYWISLALDYNKTIAFKAAKKS